MPKSLVSPAELLLKAAQFAPILAVLRYACILTCFFTTKIPRLANSRAPVPGRWSKAEEILWVNMTLPKSATGAQSAAA